MLASPETQDQRPDWPTHIGLSAVVSSLGCWDDHIMGDSWSLYTAPADLVDAGMVRQFITGQRESGVFTESTTLELKAKISKTNVIKAIAALANADGGLILVGVDENNPDFDSSPGVSADSAKLHVVDQCRSLLAPTIIPEMLEVALPSNPVGNVVLVIRVEPAGVDVPVVLGGTVYVRAPGSSLPATRDQILAIVQRAQTVRPAGQVRALSSYRPDQPSAIGELPHDAVIRIAGAAWLRPRVAQAFRLGSATRGVLLNALDQSALARVPEQPDRAQTPQTGWAIQQRSANHLRVNRTYHDRSSQEDYVLAAGVHIDGPRSIFLLDLHFRQRPGKPEHAHHSDAPSPRLSRTEVSTALLAGLSAVSLDLPAALAEAASEGLWRIEPPVAWIDTGNEPLSTIAGLNELPRQVESVTSSVSLTSHEAPTTDAAVQDIILDWLQTLYLELGVDDETVPAHEDLTAAVAAQANVTS
jgi:hypothetical protein